MPQRHLVKAPSGGGGSVRRREGAGGWVHGAPFTQAVESKHFIQDAGATNTRSLQKALVLLASSSRSGFVLERHVDMLKTCTCERYAGRRGPSASSRADWRHSGLGGVRPCVEGAQGCKHIPARRWKRPTGVQLKLPGRSASATGTTHLETPPLLKALEKC